jgi:transposase, IS30 family
MSEHTAYSRLDEARRKKIEHFLDLNKSFTWIADEIGASISTISREVLTHRISTGFRVRTVTGNIVNVCALQDTCEKTCVCAICQRKGHPRCAICKKARCSTVCPDYVKMVCMTLERAPHVCNGCPKTRPCPLEHFIYHATAAQTASEKTRRESRVGINCSEESLQAARKIVVPLLGQGQSPAQIWITHADELPFSSRTLYRRIEDNVLGLTALDLPKRPVYRPRKKTKGRDCWKMPENRRYSDFSKLVEWERERVVEMDTVHGAATDTQALLTLHFRALHFQIGVMLPRCDSSSVIAALTWLKMISGRRFEDIFGIILTDRGIEFHDTAGMEALGCRVYYCDPRQSQQKGACEKNHVEVRKVFAKGKSLDGLSNADVSVAFSHINSTPRKSLYGACPLTLARRVLPTELMEGLGLKLITPDEVTLKPSILKR